MFGRINPAVWVVLFCAALWGFWWYPVALLERVGLSGPWIGLAMSAAALPVAAVMCAVDRRGRISARATFGAMIVGGAVTLYAISVNYTDFLRAVLLFYFAPAWSTLIELFFMGRRWALQSLVAITLAIGGVLLISRGEISFAGLGAIGDWMALGSGLLWSIGIAMVFSASRVSVSRVLLATAVGGVLVAIAIAWADGSVTAGIPDLAAMAAADAWPFVFAVFYMGFILAGTMWGSIHLPPAVMSYLLSVEILGGVISSTLILGERFGPFELGGTICITSAVVIEVAWTERQRRIGSAGSR